MSRRQWIILCIAVLLSLILGSCVSGWWFTAFDSVPIVPDGPTTTEPASAEKPSAKPARPAGRLVAVAGLVLTVVGFWPTRRRPSADQ